MGQYYTAIILQEKVDRVYRAFYSHDFDNGLKLMEHSWLDNDFVRVVEAYLLTPKGKRLVWAGDYADAEPDGRTLFEKVKSYVRPAFPAAKYTEFKQVRETDAWGGTKKVYKEVEVPSNCEAPVVLPTTKSHPFLVSHDLKEFVDKRKVPAVAYYWTQGRKQAIHPLPLLTSEGNGRGGGDFNTDGYGDRSHPSGDFSLIGRWARGHIQVTDTKPEGYAELNFDLVEMGAERDAADEKANAKIKAVLG